MASVHYFFVVLVSCLLLLQKTSAVGKSSTLLVGGWKPIKDVKNGHVQELGKFAVTEHNKEAKVNLKFVAVEKAESQVVSGTNYRLLVSAKDHGSASDYHAEVYEQKWTNTKKLTSFTKA